MKLREKLELFAHYMYCKAKKGTNTFTIQTVDSDMGCISGENVRFLAEDCMLILKKLSSITSKDAAKCAELAGLPSSLYKDWKVQQDCFTLDTMIFSFPQDCNNYRNMIVFREDKLSWKQVDYLRHAGYAIGVPKEMWIEEKEVI